MPIDNQLRDKKPTYSYSSVSVPPFRESTGSNLLDSLGSQSSQPNAVTLFRDQPVVDAGLLKSAWLTADTGPMVKSTSASAGSKMPRRTKVLRPKVATTPQRTPRSSALKRLSSVLREDRARSLSAGSRYLSRSAKLADSPEV